MSAIDRDFHRLVCLQSYGNQSGLGEEAVVNNWYPNVTSTWAIVANIIETEVIRRYHLALVNQKKRKSHATEISSKLRGIFPDEFE